MTDKKPKRKVERRAVAKVINVQPPRPADDLFNPFAEAKAAETPPRPSTPSRDSSPPRPSIAPARDFTRTANSIVREAVPLGAFGGKSKQLYDFLYSQTRGAVVPRMSATLSKIKLMAGADIGSEVTLKKNLDRLKAWGFIAERVIAGTHGGNEYTVYLPEEATPSRGSTPSSPLSNVESLESVETTPSSPGLSADYQRTSENPKTSSKTNTNTDDELSPLRELERELKATAGDWRPVLQLVADEVRRAASNTKGVSHPASFAAAHLTRLFAPKTRPERPQTPTTAQPTPPEEIEPPDEKTLEEFERNRRELKGN